MRGFPLLSTLAVIVLFAVAWIPLQWLAREDVPNNVETSTPEEEEASSMKVKIFGTEELMSLKVSHLGRVIIESESGSDIVKVIEGLNVPEDGIDLWVEAEFKNKGKRSALLIEIDCDDGDLISRTLWSVDGKIANSAFFKRDD